MKPPSAGKASNFSINVNEELPGSKELESVVSLKIAAKISAYE